MIQLPLQPFYVWLMVFLRVAFILTFFPLFGEDWVPVRIRIILAVVIAVALAPVVPVQAAMFPASLRGLAAMVLTEAFLGFSIGFIGRVMFATVQFAGQLAGEQIGFGIVNAIDPTGARQTSVVAEMLYILAILMFLTADLHHTFLGVMARSFAVLPPGTAAMNNGVAGFMVDLGRTMFDFALRLAMPVIVIVFATNIALGMIARAVPQINVFMESFPLRIIAGVAVLMLSLGFTVAIWENLFSDLEGMMTQVVKLMKG